CVRSFDWYFDVW
nr:immunoglobulin heavy chain junction region [Mus musculus]MBK4197355.1 immunoglobulin heavy chain junction region [Mus musculus]MBK4197356.1 immunoglobulin heavy chain junction region [Mus musculus]MBK4197358.1 immunoglobulin heavy chain junction region [Mus musculus]